MRFQLIAEIVFIRPWVHDLALVQLSFIWLLSLQFSKSSHCFFCMILRASSIMMIHSTLCHQQILLAWSSFTVPRTVMKILCKIYIKNHLWGIQLVTFLEPDWNHGKYSRKKELVSKQYPKDRWTDTWQILVQFVRKRSWWDSIIFIGVLRQSVPEFPNCGSTSVPNVCPESLLQHFPGFSHAE